MAATAGSFWVADCSQQFTDRYDNPEYQIPETMFIWGNYPLRANSDGFYGHWVVDLMKRGMEVVMIDSKVTWLSAHSRLHLRPRPPAPTRATSPRGLARPRPCLLTPRHGPAACHRSRPASRVSTRAQPVASFNLLCGMSPLARCLP